MNDAPAAAFAALAQAGGEDFLGQVSSGFRAFTRNQPLVAGLVLAALLLVIAACVAYALFQPEFDRRRRERAWYERLVQAHRLSPDERRAVEALARRAGLAHPALLFVRPGLFRQFAGTVPPDLARNLQDKLYGAEAGEAGK